MPCTRTLPLLVTALFLAACSDGADPLRPGAAAAPLASLGALPATDADLFLPDVPLRPGVTVDLHLKVFVNEDRPSAACVPQGVVLAVPGFAHTAATWRSYAEARFADPAHQACAVIALDLPGHGGSGLPEGMLFGELMLEDYVTALLAVLDQFAGSRAAPGVLIGHSQGGIVIQMAQQRLVDSGSSLRAAGIHEAQLLAPALPAGLPWSLLDSGAAGQLLSAFLVPSDPVLGPHASVPAAAWPAVFFSNLSGQVAPGAPTPGDVITLEYNAPAPLYASLQLVGAPPFSRPSIAAGIFSGRYGTRLGVVAFEQDQLIRPEETGALMAHLTGGQNAQTLIVVEGGYTVHDLFISDPEAILDSRAPWPQGS